LNSDPRKAGFSMSNKKRGDHDDRLLSSLLVELIGIEPTTS
jgi:hypothetical protein